MTEEEEEEDEEPRGAGAGESGGGVAELLISSSCVLFVLSAASHMRKNLTFESHPERLWGASLGQIWPICFLN